MWAMLFSMASWIVMLAAILAGAVIMAGLRIAIWLLPILFRGGFGLIRGLYQHRAKDPLLQPPVPHGDVMLGSKRVIPELPTHRPYRR